MKDDKFPIESASVSSCYWFVKFRFGLEASAFGF